MTDLSVAPQKFQDAIIASAQATIDKIIEEETEYAVATATQRIRERAKAAAGQIVTKAVAQLAPDSGDLQISVRISTLDLISRKGP